MGGGGSSLFSVFPTLMLWCNYMCQAGLSGELCLACRSEHNCKYTLLAVLLVDNLDAFFNT